MFDHWLRANAVNIVLWTGMMVCLVRTMMLTHGWTLGSIFLLHP